MSYSYYWGYNNLYIKVKVINQNKNVVPGVNVALSLTTPSGRVGTGTKVTGLDGTVTFSLLTAEKGTFTTKVTGVSKSGYSWDGLNTTTSIVIR